MGKDTDNQDLAAYSRTRGDARNAQYVVLAVGIGFLLLPLPMIVQFPDLHARIELYLRLIVCLGGGLVGSAIPGVLEIKLPGVKAAGAIAVTILFFFWNPARLSENPWKDYQHVWALDSAQDVYDDEARAAGKRNADVISEILDDLAADHRLLVHKESIYPTWDRHVYLASSRPALIVIHLSGFQDDQDKLPSDPEDSLDSGTSLYAFFEYMAEHAPETRYLVYSRLGAGEEGEARGSAYRKILTAIDPEALEGKLRVLSIESRHLLDPATRSDVRTAVIELLSER